MNANPLHRNEEIIDATTISVAEHTALLNDLRAEADRHMEDARFLALRVNALEQQLTDLRREIYR